jgi:hypothetical protein
MYYKHFSMKNDPSFVYATISEVGVVLNSVSNKDKVK